MSQIALTAQKKDMTKEITMRQTSATIKQTPVDNPPIIDAKEALRLTHKNMLSSINESIRTAVSCSMFRATFSMQEPIPKPVLDTLKMLGYQMAKVERPEKSNSEVRHDYVIKWN